MTTAHDIDLIVGDPNILDGEPTVRGTRVSVRTIVEMVRGAYPTVDSIVRAIPTVDRAGVEAALAYYVRHVDEIERYIDENNEALGEPTR